jgi:hypothetical protein
MTIPQEIMSKASNNKSRHADTEKDTKKVDDWKGVY